MVRVGVTPPNSDVALPPIHVQRVNPGFTQMPTRPNPATADSPLPGGASHVDVTLSTLHESVGLYWGRVLASGGIDSPFFIPVPSKSQCFSLTQVQSALPLAGLVVRAPISSASRWRAVSCTRG